MDRLFTLSPSEAVELYTAIRGGHFSHARAVYWPCTSALLTTNVFAKIEAAVEARLGRPVYFVFDELFTPSPGANFQVWHKDVEDKNFADGCFNIWIPIFSTGRGISPLEHVKDDALNEYAHVAAPPAPFSLRPLRPGELLFQFRNGRGDSRVVSAAELSSKVARPPQQRNDVFLLASSRFHAAVASPEFDMRFGIKFSLSPFESMRNAASNIVLFSMVHRQLEAEDPAFAALAPKERHRAVARVVHESHARAYNSVSSKYTVLYRALFARMVRELQSKKEP